MKGYNFVYFLLEGVKNIFIHKFMSFACVTVIVACLIITGSFSLVALNVNELIREAEQSNEILVFVDEKLSDQEALALATKIYAVSNVKSAVFQTADEALQAYAEMLGDEADLLLAGIEGKDLRHRYRVLMQDLNLSGDTADALKKLDGVGSVQYSVELSDSILSMRNAVNIICYTLAAILAVVSIFIISNTVKLATFDRREEIAIMKIVGATNAFIRWPFVVEGFILGIVGGVLAFFCQWGIYHYAGNLIADYTQLSGVLQLVNFADYALPVAVIFVTTGFFVGIGGGVLTIRKFMKV